jgi:DNA-binding transcriptional LysR family regulator
MVSLEWFRNFVAVYRAGSVSAAARERSVSQPAVSQQLAALEDAIGVPLFDRTARGMQPTPRGRTLYVELFESMDRLEKVSRSLLPAGEASRSVRFGTSPEYFHSFAMRRLFNLSLNLSVTFGTDEELIEQLEEGALDLAVTVTKPGGRTLQFRPLGEQRFVLIGPMTAILPERTLSLKEMANWLNQRNWVSYSEERPITRRFWQNVLGARFEAETVLVVPDLRAVISAVALGIGMSIVPEFACRDAIADNLVREIWPVGNLIPSERWTLAYREVDGDREDLRQIWQALERI